LFHLLMRFQFFKNIVAKRNTTFKPEKPTEWNTM
jgi:hypothetical protein